MSAKPILRTASALQIEIVGPDLATANLGETGTPNAYAVGLGVGSSDPITGDAQVRKSVHGRGARARSLEQAASPSGIASEAVGGTQFGYRGGSGYFAESNPDVGRAFHLRPGNGPWKATRR
ncbi:hypothetical protein [Cupriavidus sp. SK-3]|uniref:hypothetical protein n=1 Tax=Cupriavidus sp. SK-3 TaxID=1470558 RepID=UPI001268611F|nr:hypothetical protein [Cupriavidus sp. SK-3]